MMLAVAVVAGAGWLVAGQLVDLANQLPTYQDNIVRKLQDLGGKDGGVLSRLARSIKEFDRAFAQPGSAGIDPADPVAVRIDETPQSSLDLVREAADQVLAPLAIAGIVTVLVTVMLLQRGDLRDRFVRLVGHTQINLTTQALDDAARRVSRYIMTQSLVNTAYGIVIALGLLALDVPNALLWGLLAGLLRFVPYVGAFMGAAMPLVVSFATSPDWTQPLMIGGLFALVEPLIANVLEPHVYGMEPASPPTPSWRRPLSGPGCGGPWASRWRLRARCAWA
jgi:predicted PurR-regulated permease PerM